MRAVGLDDVRLVDAFDLRVGLGEVLRAELAGAVGRIDRRIRLRFIACGADCGVMAPVGRPTEGGCTATPPLAKPGPPRIGPRPLPLLAFSGSRSNSAWRAILVTTSSWIRTSRSSQLPAR